MKHLMKLSMVIGIIGFCFFAMGDIPIAHAMQSDDTIRCGDFGYSLNADGTCNLEYYYGKGGTVSVPAKLDGHAVYQVNKACFSKALSFNSWTVNDTIKRLILPEGLKGINDGAVYCKNLEYISIPASLKTVDDYGFFVYGTTTEFYVNPGNQYFCSYEKGLFSKDMTKLYKGYLTDADYSVPGTVEVICGWAFSDCGDR